MERGAAPAGWARNPTLGRLRASCRAALRPLREVLARREPSSAFRRLERDRRKEQGGAERWLLFLPPPLAGEVARPKAVAGEGLSLSASTVRGERAPLPASPASGGGEED